jgi:hypothetical protein
MIGAAHLRNVVAGPGTLLKLVLTVPAHYGVSSASARLASTAIGDQEVVLFGQQSRSHWWVSASSLVAGEERNICCVNGFHHLPRWCPHPGKPALAMVVRIHMQSVNRST